MKDTLIYKYHAYVGNVYYMHILSINMIDKQIEDQFVYIYIILSIFSLDKTSIITLNITSISFMISLK